MSILNDFESTSSGAVWEPKQKGKGDDAVQLKAGDDSYLVGWYLGTKEGVGKNDSKLHEFKLKEVGNEEHVIGEIPESGKISIWGTGVLDSHIVEKGIQVGQCVAVQWKGKQKPKNGGKPYHIWEILVPTDMKKYPPLSMAEISGATTTAPVSSVENEQKEDKVVPATDAIGADDDDDLPF